jgi:uncharacterized protein YcbX
MNEVGRIAEIWRYPVKSMAGERVDAVEIGTLGMHADRMWAVRDIELGATTSAKRLPTLMFLTARFAATPPADAGPGKAPEVIIGFPDGSEMSSSDPEVHQALSQYLDRDVELRPLPPLEDKKSYRGPLMTKTDLRTIMGIQPDEPLPDLSMFPIKMLAELMQYATPVGTYADVYPLHLITDQTLRTMAGLAPNSDWDVRRFRPSVLIETSDTSERPEWEWSGGTLRTEGAALEVLFPTIRCVMPSHEQPELKQDRDITRTIAATSRRCLGAYGTVPRPGRIAEGDVLTLERGEHPLGSRPDATLSKIKRSLLRAGNAAMPKGKART